MDPITAGLFVAASLASTLLSNKNQSKVEAASINMQLSQSKLQAADSAYERTKQFRENISANLSLSGLGVGGVSGFRGVATREAEDYFSDVSALETSNVFANAQASGASAYSRSKRFSNDIGAVGDAAALASQLGLFQKSTGKTKPASLGGRTAGKVR